MKVHWAVNLKIQFESGGRNVHHHKIFPDALDFMHFNHQVKLRWKSFSHYYSAVTYTCGLE